MSAPHFHHSVYGGSLRRVNPRMHVSGGRRRRRRGGSGWDDFKKGFTGTFGKLLGVARHIPVIGGPLGAIHDVAKATGFAGSGRRRRRRGGAWDIKGLAHNVGHVLRRHRVVSRLATWAGHPNFARHARIAGYGRRRRRVHRRRRGGAWDIRGLAHNVRHVLRQGKHLSRLATWAGHHRTARHLRIAGYGRRRGGMRILGGRRRRRVYRRRRGGMRIFGGYRRRRRVHRRRRGGYSVYGGRRINRRRRGGFTMRLANPWINRVTATGRRRRRVYRRRRGGMTFRSVISPGIVNPYKYSSGLGRRRGGSRIILF